MLQPFRGSDIRQINERLVVNLFYELGTVSQSDVVAHTGLKASTVLRIFSNLEANGEIYMMEPSSSDTKRDKVGRKPVYYRLNPDSHNVIGVTVHPDAFDIVIVDFTLRIIYSAHERIPSLSLDTFISEISDAVERHLKLSGINPLTVLGMGIGFSEDLAVSNKIISPAQSFSSSYSLPFVENLEKKLHFRVLAQSTNFLSAQYYQRYNDHMKFQRGLYLSIGSQLTACLYDSNSKLSGMAFLPIGDMFMQQPDEVFGISSVHTLNDFCSESSILQHTNAVSNINNIKDLEQAILDKNPKIINMITKISSLLSFWIGNLTTLFMPDTIILASQSQQLSELIIEEVNRILTTSYNFNNGKTDIQLIGVTNNMRIVSRSAIDLIFDDEFDAHLGWSRPKLLDSPNCIESWKKHINI